MPAINEWLNNAVTKLSKAGITSSRLDAEIILAHTLRRGRTYLHAHGTLALTQWQQDIADARLTLRLDRTPIAYIIGHKEFYGRLFKVNTSTLIPRPESETMIEMLKEILPATTPFNGLAEKRLVDVGTGSGCLGITAKLEFPEMLVTLLDISKYALNVAVKNADRLGADIQPLYSDLLLDYAFAADIVLANLPYVDAEWERSPETQHEPALALFAKDHGLHYINKLLHQTHDHLVSKGHLFIEADKRQHEQIIKLAKAHGLNLTDSRDLILYFRKG